MPPDLARRNVHTPTATTTTTTASNTQYFTMKTTSSRPALGSPYGHPHHHNQPHHANSPSCRPNISTTPLASPRMPPSVGQSHPPKLSPAAPSDLRSSSPNYFGLAVDQSKGRESHDTVPHDHWSSPSSSIRSFGTALPKQVPLDANPDFEAFKRQADINRGKSSAFVSTHMAPQSSSVNRPKLPPRWPTNDSASDLMHSRMLSKMARDFPGNRNEGDADSLHDSAYVSSDSKRNSETSLMNASVFGGLPRYESPAQAESVFDPSRRMIFSKADDRNQRLSLPGDKNDNASETSKFRADTSPSSSESSQGLMLGSQLKDILERASEEEFLLLDVRVSTQYSTSRIRGALNLCIPTTLLKRPAFDLKKLQQTLQTQEDQDRFAQWPKVKYLVVYDGSSTEKRDAPSAVNMFKKFTNEGYSGNTYLLRGGFHQFQASYPALIDRRSAAERAGTAVSASANGRPNFAPVIGGVTLPTTAHSPNPFFNNIRQNMDLADGVGQLDIGIPSSTDLSSLPPWLNNVLQPSDHGKKVAQQFLNIEKNEQRRMKAAYSVLNPNLGHQNDMENVQLSGVEKGVKNRYKDILPFEHSRVRLPDRSEGDCDYVNASHVKASRSNKRYIASQGPLPATFEDFWSVIWDQDVRVIVMLTAESEGGQLKCHSYWNNRDFGPLRLRPLSEKKVSLDIDKHRSSSTNTPSTGGSAADSGRRRANTTTTFNTAGAQPPNATAASEAPHVIIRKFALSHASHPFAPIREITHLHYPSWPDFGAPAQPSHLLALVELANVMQHAALPVDASAIAASAATHSQPSINWLDEPELNEEPRPMLVHCSAGCGRTGTFCTVDSVIDMLKRQRLSRLSQYRQRRDGDGDLNMYDSISPLDYPARHNSSPPKKAKTKPNDGIDLEADWIHDPDLDLIASTVGDLRTQRLSMVQSLRQFVLCYETIVEWINRIQDRGATTLSAGGKTRFRSGSLNAGR